GDLLNADDEEYELANLLNCMVTNAPHRTGRRFVCVAIILAYQQHKVVELAKAWMEDFVIALLTRSIEMHKSVSEPLKVGGHVRRREKDHCALTQYIDADQIFKYYAAGSLDPAKVYYLFVEYFIPIPPSDMSAQFEFAYSMLWTWGGLTEDDWVRRIHNEENALLIASAILEDHRSMTTYFEPKEDTPNAYTARKIRGLNFLTGDASYEVLFHSWLSIIVPPDPRLVKVRRELVQLVDSSGAIDTYLSRNHELLKMKESIEDIKHKGQGIFRSRVQRSRVE
ncbi:hypothetical protein CPC08DRAFT_714039, partial [Agrocybe pediades]